MRTARCLVTVAFVVTLSTGLALAKPNFTGEWKMAAAKSDFGQMPAPTSIVQKITHNEPELQVVSTSTSDRGEFTTTSSYTTDGKECTNKTRMGESKSTLKWDGDTLVVDSKADFRGNVINILNRWSLSEDGKTLTINGHFTSPMGEMDTKTVFEKQ